MTRTKTLRYAQTRADRACHAIGHASLLHYDPHDARRTHSYRDRMRRRVKGLEDVRVVVCGG